MKVDYHCLTLAARNLSYTSGSILTLRATRVLLRNLRKAGGVEGMLSISPYPTRGKN